MVYTLTNNGAVLMTQVAAGKTILFTRAESGSGYAASPATLQGVIDKKQELFLDEVTYENKQAVVKTILTNMQLEEAYQLRQVGVYAKLEGDETDTLVIIGQQYNGEKIPPHQEGIINIEYEIHAKVSGTGNVTIEGVGTGYVTKAQFLTHLSDISNPHKVTARQVGLENVPNVGTDDQTPEFSEAEERENIVSGEKMTVLFGKIRKWLSDLGAAAFCSVANNLVTMLPGSVLDARQGKELQDQISQLYSDILALKSYLKECIDFGYLPDPSLQQILLYDSGNEYVPITGGWIFANNYGDYINLTNQKTDTYLHLNGRTGGLGGWYTTQKALDFTKVKKLKILYTFSYSTNTEWKAFVYLDNFTGSNHIGALETISEKKECTIDVSNITESILYI